MSDTEIVERCDGALGFFFFSDFSVFAGKDIVCLRKCKGGGVARKFRWLILSTLCVSGKSNGIFLFLFRFL